MTKTPKIDAHQNAEKVPQTVRRFFYRQTVKETAHHHYRSGAQRGHPDRLPPNLSATPYCLPQFCIVALPPNDKCMIMKRFSRWYLLVLCFWAAFSAMQAQAQSPQFFANAAAPNALACGPDGKLYVSLKGQNSIVGFNPNGSSFELPSGTQGLDNPAGLACDKTGNLYVANAAEGNSYNSNPATFIKITSNGSVSTVASIESGNQVSALAIDAYGNLYETNLNYGFGASQVTKISPTGQLTNLTNDYFGGVDKVTCDASGNVYFGTDYQTTLYKATPSGEVSPFKDNQKLTSLAADAYGNIYLGYKTVVETINQDIYNALDPFYKDMFDDFYSYGYASLFLEMNNFIDPNLITTTTTGHVSRISSDGTETVVATGSFNPSALAFDNVGGYLYVGDATNNNIVRYSLMQQPDIASLVLPAAAATTLGSYTLTAPASNSAGEFTYTSSNPNVATISGNTLQVVGYGTTTITATQALAYPYVGGSVATNLNNVKVCIPTYSTISASACSSYTWHGTTYTASGTYTFDSLNAAGCDSLTTLNLTIKQPTTVTLNQSACGSYNWHGTTYTTSGTYTFDSLNAAGCDSLTTLNLTIKQPTEATLNQSACGSYNWHGTTYTTSGTYTFDSLNAAGCDSLTTLNLTIKQPTEATLNQ